MTDFILLDTSASMAESVGTLAGPTARVRRRIDVLTEILHNIKHKFPRVRLIVFNSTAYPVENTEQIPTTPSGSTALHLALETVADTAAAEMQPVNKVIVISDGEPNSPEDALTIARSLEASITTYFCGPDDNHDAISFMRRLSWCSSDGLGSSHFADLTAPAKLAHEVTLLLSGPIPTSN
jgi:hypothetical protein